MEILKYPHKALTTVCDPVEEFNEELLSQIEEMKKLMEENNGIGLAANQVGILKRFFIIKTNQGIVTVCNPEITNLHGTVDIEEGCLSAPGISITAPTRSKYVTVKFNTETGEEREAVFMDTEAVCVQHEADHVNGIFFFNKFSRQVRRALHRKWDKIRKAL